MFSFWNFKGNNYLSVDYYNRSGDQLCCKNRSLFVNQILHYINFDHFICMHGDRNNFLNSCIIDTFDVVLEYHHVYACFYSSDAAICI